MFTAGTPSASVRFAGKPAIYCESVLPNPVLNRGGLLSKGRRKLWTPNSFTTAAPNVRVLLIDWPQDDNGLGTKKVWIALAVTDGELS